ncbi:hypothetical protein E0198_000906 [Clavispora lusitaniae]|nr:hypothetical protein E0198_000906 [Clavispora lusitaniae]
MSNPLVDRILSNPLTFVAAKQPEKETHEQPPSYIVLGKKSKPLPNMLKPKTAKPEVKRPKSMAEAIAAYTGKKYASKEKKPKPRPESSDDEKYESASEFQTDSSFQGFKSSEGSDTKSDKSDKSDESDSEDGEYESAGVSIDSETDGEESGSDSEPESDSQLEVSALEEESGEQSDEEKSEVETETKSEPMTPSTETQSKESSFDEPSQESDRETETPNETLRTLKRELKEELQEDPKGKLPDNENGSLHQNEKELIDKEQDDDSHPSGKLTQTKQEDSQELYEFLRPNEPRPQSGRIATHWSPSCVSSRPSGLVNFGVTCYMNSAIQAMMHIPAVQQYLAEVQQGKHKLPPRSVTHTFAELANKMWRSGSRKYVNPKRLVQRLGDINCMMSEWQQEDSHEYLMSLMARLQEDSTPKGRKLAESVVYDIFGGVLDQEVVCQQCGGVSTTKQEFYDLSLGLRKRRAEGGRYSIEKSIADFFSRETIKRDAADAASGYHCERCQQRTVATKKSTVADAPQTLVVHVKRFKFNGNSSAKVKQPVAYTKYLDLTPYMTSGSECRYQLLAVIVHEGRSMSSGHYVAHCLQPDGTWATYDDEYINQIAERDALNDPAAYCLVYTRLERRKEGEGSERVKRTQKQGGKQEAKRARVA